MAGVKLSLKSRQPCLFQAATCCINFIPFTSAAIISKKHKIPSAYLDPTKSLDKKFLINNEVSLLLSKEELFQWYIKHVLKNNEKVKN